MSVRQEAASACLWPPGERDLTLCRHDGADSMVGVWRVQGDSAREVRAAVREAFGSYPRTHGVVVAYGTLSGEPVKVYRSGRVGTPGGEQHER